MLTGVLVNSTGLLDKIVFEAMPKISCKCLELPVGNCKFEGTLSELEKAGVSRVITEISVFCEIWKRSFAFLTAMLESAYANVDDRPRCDLESFKVNKGCDIKTYCGVVSLANMSVSVSFETSTVSFEVISSSALLSFAISTNPLTFESTFSTLTELTGKNLPIVKVAFSASLFPEALR